MTEERDDIVVLVDEEGNEKEFEYLDIVEMNNKEYVVLLPLEENETRKDGEGEEVLILRIEQNEDGEDVFASVDDSEELNQVFEQFKKQAEDEYEFTE